MSKKVSVRIDERLIHGQVAALWSKALHLNRIVVVDNEVIKNDMQKMLLKTATPAGIKLSIISAQRAADNFNAGKYDEETTLVIVKGPATLREIKDAGYSFESVNVGNITSKPGSKTITKQIYVTDEQIQDFKDLAALTNFYVQLVPDAAPKEFMSMLVDQ